MKQSVDDRTELFEYIVKNKVAVRLAAGSMILIYVLLQKILL